MACLSVFLEMFNCSDNDTSLGSSFPFLYSSDFISSLSNSSACLILLKSREVLGEPVEARFGKDFPIRFDFLDTVGGGNLSVQVHPTTQFIRENFGMAYTQDESYYLLDAKEGASVYLGLKTGINEEEMIHDLREAQKGERVFDAEKYVNRLPAKKHDHYLIPGGTVHCSGAEALVLEISSTPNLFTFKLWDWQRLGLDGKPRPINVERGKCVIDWKRNTEYVHGHLANHVTPVAEGDGWREERTGLHPNEFIETRRHWFTKPVTHHTGGVAGAAKYILPGMLREMHRSLSTFAGDSFPCLQMEVCDLTDAKGRAAFLESTAVHVPVPFSEKRAYYDSHKRIGVTVSRLGANRAIALGAYAFALQQIDRG